MAYCPMRAKAKSSLRIFSSRARRSSAIRARRCQSSGVGGTGDVSPGVRLGVAVGGTCAPPFSSQFTDTFRMRDMAAMTSMGGFCTPEQ